MTVRENQDEPEDWRLNALCFGRDPNDFFPEERNKTYTAEYKREVEELRNFCATCPFQRECLEDAMRHDNDGVWAGTTKSQRNKLLKEILANDDEEL